MSDRTRDKIVLMGIAVAVMVIVDMSGRTGLSAKVLALSGLSAAIVAGWMALVDLFWD